MEPGLYTKNEILSQPEAWADALDQVEHRKAPLRKILDGDTQQVLFTGCGSTYYLALAAASLFQEMTGRIARAVPASVLLLDSRSVLTSGKSMLVAISRSGSTTETVRAVEHFKAHSRGEVLAITNYADQPLAGLADEAVIIEKGQEQSVAQTRSFASMYVASTALAMLAAGREESRASMYLLPRAGEMLLAQYHPLAREVGRNRTIDSFFFLGSATRYGLASEASLKMKEMTLSNSEPFHFLEFRHGPMSMIDDHTLVVGLLSEKNDRHERAVLDEMREKGAQTLELSESRGEVSFNSGIAEEVRGVLYLPVLQLLAFYRSLEKGLNPDCPKNLAAVVKLSF